MKIFLNYHVDMSSCVAYASIHLSVYFVNSCLLVTTCSRFTLLGNLLSAAGFIEIPF